MVGIEFQKKNKREPLQNQKIFVWIGLTPTSHTLNKPYEEDRRP